MDDGLRRLSLGCPGGFDLLERERLDVDRDPTGGNVLGHFEIGLSTLVSGESEVRMAEDRQALTADGCGRQGRLRASRLTDVDDPRAGSGCLDSRLNGSPSIDYQCWPVAAGCLAQPFGQVASVERDGRVGAELAGALEAIVVATRGDDPFRPQQTGDLERNRAHGSSRPEDEHAIVGANGCPLGEG